MLAIGLPAWCKVKPPGLDYLIGTKNLPGISENRGDFTLVRITVSQDSVFKLRVSNVSLEARNTVQD